MLFSSRLVRILKILLEQNDDQGIKINDLAARLAISRRTVFRELEGIDESLAQMELKLVSHPQKGLFLQGSPEARKNLMDALKTKKISYSNKDERLMLLLYELLQHPGSEKLIYYANRFQVSEATISNDLTALDEMVRPYHLKMGKGGIIEGSENDRRRLMGVILQKNLSSRPVNYLNKNELEEQVFQMGNDDSIMHLLNQQLLKQILSLFEDYQHELNLDRYAQSSYIGLVIHLVIAIDRIKNNESLVQRPEDIELSEESLQDARRLAHVLEKEFDLRFPDAEIDYIALHLQGAKISYLPHSQNPKKPWDAQLKKLVEQFTYGYGPELGSYLMADHQFLQGLITHLEPALTRIRSDLPIFNPMLDQLKSQYSDLFAKTKQAASCIEEYLGKPVSDGELGFLTMHVGASLERIRHIQRPPVKTAVVCASGIGVSSLLSARLEKTFPGLLNMKTLSLEEAGSAGQYELIISTLPLNHKTIPVVEVSALLDERDEQAIRRMIDRIPWESKGEQAAQKDFQQQMEDVQNAGQAASQLLVHFKMPAASVSSSRDLILAAAQAADGDTEIIFKDLTKREELGSVVSAEDGFVLFHAVTDGTLQIQYFIIYPEGKTFGPPYENIQFAVVCLLPAKHTRAQQDLLALLNMTMIDNPAYLAALKSRRQNSIQNFLMKISQDYVQKQMQ